MNRARRKILYSVLIFLTIGITLGSSTYAWYTSNMTATASGVTGTTSGETDNTLLISKTGEAGTFHDKIKINRTDAGFSQTRHFMIPVYYKSSKFYDIDGKELGKNEDGTPDNNFFREEVLQFSVYVKTQSTAEPLDLPVYLKSLNVKNGAGNQLPSTEIISSYKDGDWAAGATTYKVDAVRTINIAFASAKANYASGSAVADRNNIVGTTAYSVRNIVTPENESGLGTSPNALEYYNKIMGTNKTVPSAEEYKVTLLQKSQQDGAPVEVSRLQSKDVYEIIFTVWMDGWNDYCFDACKQQAFDIDFSLTTNNEGPFSVYQEQQTN